MASRYWVGGAGTWDNSDTTHWSAGSGGAGGQSAPSASDDVIFDAASGGGTVLVGADVNVKSITIGTFTGTLNFAATNPTMQTFSNSGTGVRTLTMGTGSWTISGNNGTIFDQSTTTNLTFSATTATVILSYSGATGTRTFQIGTVVFGGTLNISSGSDAIKLFSSTGGSYGNINFTGFTGSLGGGGSTGITITGNFTLGSGMTTADVDATHPFVFSSGTTQTITSNGVTLNHGITVQTAGTNIVLADALTLGALHTLTLTTGTFNANNFNVSCGLLASSGTGTRTLTMGTGTWSLTGVGTILTFATATNLTLSAASCTLKITDTSSSSKTLSLGAVTGGNIYGGITVTAGGSGAVIFSPTATTTISTFICIGPKTLTFAATRTFAVTNWYITGSYGNLVTIASSSAGSAFTLSVASGVVTSRYVSLQDSTATGGATFYAINSVNVSGNTGWTFVASRIPVSNRASIIFRQNLLKYSDDISIATAGNWDTVHNAVVTANQAVNPVTGSQTAALLSDDNANTYHEIAQSVSGLAANTYCYSVLVKRNTARWIALAIQPGSATAYFDIQNGETGVTSGTGLVSSFIQPTYYGNGWYLVGIVYTGAPTQVQLYTANANNVVSYAGASAISFYVAHAQLAQVASPDQYTPTTSAAISTGSMRNYMQPQNLISISEPKTLGDIYSKSNITVDAFTWATPSTATTCLTFGDNSIIRTSYQLYTPITGNTYTFSVYARMDDLSVPKVASSGASDDFMLLFGTTAVAATVTSVGNNIYRLSYTGIGDATKVLWGVLKYVSNSNKTFKIIGYHLAQTNYLMPYTKTYSTALNTLTPRFKLTAGARSTLIL